MPSADGVFLRVVKRRNSMITEATSPAAIASTKALHSANSQLSALLSDYAIALPPTLTDVRDPCGVRR
jgi:hypothetical protein